MIQLYVLIDVALYSALFEVFSYITRSNIDRGSMISKSNEYIASCSFFSEINGIEYHLCDTRKRDLQVGHKRHVFSTQ